MHVKSSTSVRRKCPKITDQSASTLIYPFPYKSRRAPGTSYIRKRTRDKLYEALLIAAILVTQAEEFSLDMPLRACRAHPRVL